jgi:hypothetical protein
MRFKSTLAGLIATGASIVPTLSANPAPHVNMKPSLCSSPEFHQWDFWLGAWRVTDQKGVFQGTNEITRAPSGCGLLENWRGAGGGQGMSFNGYDTVRKTWTQLWISPSSFIRLEGRLDEHGVMRMAGTISYSDKELERPFRGNWSLQRDGTVKQEFFEFDPETKVWSEWFTGIYRRAPL